MNNNVNNDKQNKNLLILFQENQHWILRHIETIKYSTTHNINFVDLNDTIREIISYDLSKIQDNKTLINTIHFKLDYIIESHFKNTDFYNQYWEKRVVDSKDSSLERTIRIKPAQSFDALNIPFEIDRGLRLQNLSDAEIRIDYFRFFNKGAISSELLKAESTIFRKINKSTIHKIDKISFHNSSDSDNAEISWQIVQF